jgi:hypothetical protein
MSKKYITDNIKIDGQLLDGSGSAGTSGQILSSTGTATDWINLSDISGVDGSGSAERLAVWSDSDTISYHDNLRWDGEKLMVESGNSSTSSKTVSITHTRNDSNVSTQAITIDANFSGADTTTADRTNAGLYIDLDSSADGDASNEVRSYGVWVDARITGYNDLLRGGYFFVESNNITEKTAEIAGVYGHATHDSSSTNGGVSNMFGVRGVTAIQDYGDVDNTYAVHGLVQIADNRNANVDNTHALYGEIQIDEATALSYGSMYGCRVVIDNNQGSVPTFSDQYLFYGAYQGTTATGAYGIYVQGDRHYLAGSVGIGETNPARALEVKHSTQQGVARFVSGSTTMAFIDLKDANTTADNKVRFGAVGNELSLWANGGERMRINSAGNVLVNKTSSTGDMLQVQGDNNVYSLRLDGSSTVGQSYGLRVRAGTSSADKSMLVENTGGTDLFLVRGDGNVGIGTDSPGAKLQIGSATYAPNANLGNNLLQIKSPSGFAYLTIGNGDSANSTSYIGGASGFTVIGSVTDAGALSEYARITNAGEVGIGTTSPTATLHVESANDTLLRLKSTDNKAIIALSDNDTNGYISSENDKLSLGANTGVNANNLNIDLSSNNVGIGTTSPGTKLEVEGTTTTDNIVYDRPSATGQYRGELVYFGSFAETTAAGDLICLSTDAGSPVWRLANNGNSVDSTGMLGIALGSNPDDGILVRGYARSTAYSSLVDGGKCYISGTNGDMTTTAPGTGTYLRIVGYVIDNVGGIGSYGEIYFCPDNTWVEIA